MYLHLGQDTVVPNGAVIGIFNLDVVSQSARTRDFLARAEADGLVEAVSDELPVSFVLYGKDGKTRVYLSQISAATLGRRFALKNITIGARIARPYRKRDRQKEGIEET